jgi:type IV secretory pathway VirD2 relaxase
MSQPLGGMMKRQSNLTSTKEEPDRVGRMGGRRHGERSVNSQLARRLQGFKGRSRSASSKQSKSGSSGYDKRQRVVTKAMVSRHKVGKAAGSLARHAKYLGRESASADGKPGVFYDVSRDGVDAKSEITTWADDRHHFRLIVSPEHGSDIPDMTAYVREVMRRVERDLDTKLTWVAVNHDNTDNPHAHVVLRGRKADGTDLVIPRQYISYGVRDRASEVATELLGERSAAEVKLAQSKEVTAERFTSLDRMIERHLKDGEIDVSKRNQIGFGADDRKLVIGRLQFLESIDLAHKGRGSNWRVEGEFKTALRELGARNDIIHQLYRTLGAESGRVTRMNASGELSGPVAGVVIAKGSIDEISEDRFVVVRDAAGKAHYGRVRDGDPYRDARIGSLAELGAVAHERLAVSRRILTVSAANGGVYSEQLHDTYLRQVDPAMDSWAVESAVRSGSARLAFVSGQAGSGVSEAEFGVYRIDSDQFSQFGQRGTQRTDVRSLAGHALADQVDAKAVTWLDRQAFGDRPNEALAAHPAVREALAKRAEWLVQNGYAERTGAGDGGVQLQLQPGALRELAEAERSALADRLGRKHDLPVEELPRGGTVMGTYQGTESLHAGKRVVITTEDAVYVSPTSRTPDAAVGSEVTVQRQGDRRTTVEQVAQQGAGQSLDGRTQRAIDGLEAGL